MIFLEDDFYEHPKLEEVGPAAGWVWVSALGYLKQRRSTDGRIPKAKLPKIHETARRMAPKLVAAGLWHDEGDAFKVHEYELHNAASIRRSEAAREKARKRWGHAAGSDAPADAAAPPGADAGEPAGADAPCAPPPLSSLGLDASSGSTALASNGEEESATPQPLHPAAVAYAAAEAKLSIRRSNEPIVSRPKWLDKTAAAWLHQYGNAVDRRLPDWHGNALELARTIDPDLGGNVGTAYKPLPPPPKPVEVEQGAAAEARAALRKFAEGLAP